METKFVLVMLTLLALAFYIVWMATQTGYMKGRVDEAIYQRDQIPELRSLPN